MSKLITIAVFTLSLLWLPLHSRAQNPCAELPPVPGGGNPTAEKNPLEQTFSPPEGRFKIGLPPAKAVKPESNNEQKSASQMIRYNWLILNLGRFEVSYYDADKNLDNFSTGKILLDNLRNTLLSKSEGKLETDKELSIDSFPGREIKIRDGRGINIARFYLVKNRLYNVGVFIPLKLECAVEGAIRVLDSFELINEK